MLVRLRQKDHKFQANLGNTVSSGPTWTMRKDPDSKIKHNDGDVYDDEEEDDNDNDVEDNVDGGGGMGRIGRWRWKI